MSLSDGQEQQENAAGAVSALHEVTRLWWTIVLVAVVATAAAYAFSAIQPPKYKAEATLASAYTDPAALLVQVQQMTLLLADPANEAAFASKLGQPLPAGGSVSASSSAGLVGAAVITAEASTASLAARLANAYAAAIMSARARSARSLARHEASRVRAQLVGLSLADPTYRGLAQSLADNKAAAKTATGGFRILSPAVPPARPYTPRPARAALLGLVLGLFVGVGLAFVLRRFDTRLASSDDVAALLHLPILARIPRVVRKQPHREQLVSVRDPGGVGAEAYRRLRFSLEAGALSESAKVLLLTSPVEGEGVSITLSNLAVALARTGAQVAVVDANLRFPMIHAHFGIPNDKGVSTVVAGRTSLVDSLQSVAVSSAAERHSAVGAPGGASHESLHVLTSGPPVDSPGDILAGQRMGGIIAGLRQIADIVLVGSSALLGTADALALASKADGLILLVDVPTCRRPALQESRNVLSLSPCPKLGVVLTDSRGTGRRRSKSRVERAVPTGLPLSPETGAEE